MKPFPGIENITTNDLVYRSLGGPSSHQLFGAGFMNKSGVRDDSVDLVFPHYVIVYVMHGCGTYIDDRGVEYQLGPGDFFQRFPGRRHSVKIDPDSGWRECFVIMAQEFSRFCSSMGIFRSEDPVGRIGLDSSLIARLWHFKETAKTAAEEDLPAQALECLSVAAEFHRCLGLTRYRGRMGQMIDNVCDRLGRDFHQHPDLPSLCREYGCGYESFRKQFRRQVGLSPGQYRIRRRIEAACEMLNGRCYDISEISWMLGYSSPFEFSAQFKKYTGVAPIHFRVGQEPRLKG